MILQRILTVISAAFLVASVAIASLVPPGMPLGQTLIMMDRASFASFQRMLDHQFPAWFSEYVALPLLSRPAWLLPAAVGIICAGFAASLAFNQGARNHHRRRS